VDKTRPSYPLLRVVWAQRQPEKLTLFTRELGVFSQNGIAVWMHLAECYLQLEKYPTSEKCMKQVLTGLYAYLTSTYPDSKEEEEP
jgi:hypothetical protein